MQNCWLGWKYRYIFWCCCWRYVMLQWKVTLEDWCSANWQASRWSACRDDYTLTRDTPCGRFAFWNWTSYLHTQWLRLAVNLAPCCVEFCFINFFVEKHCYVGLNDRLALILCCSTNVAFKIEDFVYINRSIENWINKRNKEDLYIGLHT